MTRYPTVQNTISHHFYGSKPSYLHNAFYIISIKFEYLWVYQVIIIDCMKKIIKGKNSSCDKVT